MLLLVFGGADIRTEYLVPYTNGYDLLLFVEELKAVPAADLLPDGQLRISILRPLLYNVDECLLALFADQFGLGLLLFKPHAFLF